MAKTHRIAVVPGDGIGKETVPEALGIVLIVVGVGLLVSVG